MKAKGSLTFLSSVGVLLISITNAAYSEKKELSDTTIKQRLIQQSILAYPSSCPCPYNRDNAGRRCGKRSAWSRAGGYSPLCYPGDITPKMMKEYKDNKVVK